jgi:hypothetical protein
MTRDVQEKRKEVTRSRAMNPISPPSPISSRRAVHPRAARIVSPESSRDGNRNGIIGMIIADRDDAARHRRRRSADLGADHRRSRHRRLDRRDDCASASR